MNDDTRKALELARDGLKDLWKPLSGSLYIDGSRPAVVVAIQKAIAAIDATLAPAAPVAPAGWVVRITTAYEQGVGHSLRSELSNPYTQGSPEREAWSLGRDEGKRQRAINAPVAQGEPVAYMVSMHHWRKNDDGSQHYEIKTANEFNAAPFDLEFKAPEDRWDVEIPLYAAPSPAPASQPVSEPAPSAESRIGKLMKDPRFLARLRDELREVDESVLAASAAPTESWKLVDFGAEIYLDGIEAQFSIEDASGRTVAYFFRREDADRAVLALRPASVQPLTEEQVFADDVFMSLNARLGLLMTQIMPIVRCVERSHGIGQGGAA